jgi:hypothetical protein
MHIPRVAICDGHSAPFDFLADIYFERVTSAIALASRGGSKTLLSAIIHLLNSLYKPRCESISVGAQLAQAERVYENFKKLVKIHGKVDNIEKHPMITKSIQLLTTFVNDSELSIIPGTIGATNGPHVPKVHTDEAEIMDYNVYLESRNISQSLTYLIDGQDGDQVEVTIIAQDWVTSTRKSGSGLMQKLIDGIDEAEKNGYDPPYKLYAWCMAESAQNQKGCQVAFPDLSDSKKCNCHKIVKDTWEDGSPRIFVDICKGRLAKSDGFTTLGDIHKRFIANDQDTWEAQQECAKPETGGMVFKTFTTQRYSIKWWEPDPQLGPIVQGVDFSGGTNPAAVEWYQILNRDTVWWGSDQSRSDKPNKLLKSGTRINFDEIYKSNLGNMELANLVKAKENYWKSKYPDFEVQYRFVDPSNKDNRLDWYSIGLKTQFFCTRSIPEQCRTCNDLLKQDIFVYDSTRVIMFPLEAYAYHYATSRMGKEYDPEIPFDDFNHTCSAWRYAMENLKVLERKGTIRGVVPRSSDKIHYTAKASTKSSGPRYLSSSYLKGP